MTKYFELVIGETTSKNVAEWLANEIVGLPPVPVAIGQGEELEITDFEVKPPGDDDLPFYHLIVDGSVRRVGSEFPIGEAKGRLVSSGGRNLSAVISVQFRETGPGSVHLLGECDDSLADFVEFKIERIKQLWPKTRELTPEGVSRATALTWDEPLSQQQAEEAGTTVPRIPRREADFRRWQQVWKEAKPLYNAKYSDEEIYSKLSAKIKSKCSLDILHDILVAGRSGQLDRD